MAQDATPSDGLPAPDNPPDNPAVQGTGPDSRRRTWILAALLLAMTTVVGVKWVAPDWPDTDCGWIKKDPACTRVLFIGNSYTYVNDLPGTFARLARSGGHPVATGQLASGGWSLADHAASSKTAKRLKSRHWDTAVLQEQSVVPASRQARTTQMQPAARTLISSIRSAGTSAMLFLTWGRRDGLPEGGLPDFHSMQAALDTGYLSVAADQHVPVAPVGEAWAAALDRGLDSNLWASDGSHPTKAGTYLAACVFYVSLFGQSPVGLDYRGGLSKAAAADLQQTAAAVVEHNRSRWGL